MNIEIDVSGLKKIEDDLEALGAQLATKAVREGFRKASRPMFKAAKANALSVKDSGALAAAMGTFSKSPRGGTRSSSFGTNRFFQMFIGPRAKSKKGLALWAEHNNREMPRRLRHAHMAEFGTEDTPATPYLRPAFAAHARGFVSAVGAELRAAIRKFAATRK